MTVHEMPDDRLPKPANRYAQKFMTPVAVPARRCPTRSGQSAQNEDCGPYTKKGERLIAAFLGGVMELLKRRGNGVKHSRSGNSMR
jgi:hypothetical protein